MKHIVGFSGGIDSQACARWVLNRYPAEDVILTNSDAGGWEDSLVPGMFTNTVDQVLEWARTSRGGRQQLFPILHEREGCESKYGLCE